MSEYGQKISMTEAFEEFALACRLNGLVPPTAMVFDKESIEKLSMQFFAKERLFADFKSTGNITGITTGSGHIEIKDKE